MHSHIKYNLTISYKMLMTRIKSLSEAMKDDQKSFSSRSGRYLLCIGLEIQ